MTLTSIAFVCVVSLFTAAAAVVDLRLHRIPNYLTVPAAVAGLLFHGLLQTFSGWGALWALAGCGVGFGLLFVPWLLGGSGMGDVKLLAALGAWLGPLYILFAFAGSMMLAAFMSLAVLFKAAVTEGVSTAQRRYLTKGRSSKPQHKKRARPMRVLPFAVPVALSTWVVLAWLTVARGNDFLN